MLEKYFLRLATIDRIRKSWIGPAIEKYVTWLDERPLSEKGLAFLRCQNVRPLGLNAVGLVSRLNSASDVYRPFD